MSYSVPAFVVPLVQTAQLCNVLSPELGVSNTHTLTIWEFNRYPKGLVMHFTKDGEISSSDESSKDWAAKISTTKPGMTPHQKEKKRVIAKELIKVVPGARNIIFLGLWDFSRARWSAGCFVWSSRPERLLHAQDDLLYIKAFANVIMCEIHRLEAVVSDQAKVSFIANVSHELRSPLHGILGSIEFLQDTSAILDPFQASMITTVCHSRVCFAEFDLCC